MSVKKCGNCMAESGNCSKCRARYPQGTAVHCTQPACAAAKIPVECQCGLLVSDDLAGVLDMDAKLVPWLVE